MNRKKAIVTGGSSGIGRGVVYCLAEAGYDVVFSARTHEDAAKRVLDTLNEKHPDGHFAYFNAQLTDEGAGKKIFRQAVEFLGGLDLLVNNAGYTKLCSIFDMTEELLDDMIRLMYRNYLILAREAATYMASKGTKGSIVNVSSARSISAHPNDLIYGSIKAALNRATQSIALDVAPFGIRINNILPGAVKRFTPEEEALADPAHLEKIAYLSKRIPLERYGTPEDVGNLVVFLASEKASYITGVSICVDGGLTLPGLAETAAESNACGWGRVDRAVEWNED